jgi:hypothetical protein
LGRDVWGTLFGDRRCEAKKNGEKASNVFVHKHDHQQQQQQQQQQE